MQEGNKYKYSEAYYKIRDLIFNNPNENVFVVRGGQGASKTISILEVIIQSLLSETLEATVLSSQLSKMKKTVIRDYKKICKDWDIMDSDNDFNRSESKHEYSNNDSYLDFIGADVADIGKGFRRDILYINEADKITLDSAVQFISRAGITIIDYNPDALFWGDDYINENNFITLTFNDNEFLPQSEVESILEYKEKGFHNPNLPEDELFEEKNIKNKYWANKWKVYGLGQVGSLDGVVFENWKEIDSLPPNARLLGYGLDFGYTNDPTAAIAVYKYNDSIILDEVIYQKKLSNSQIATLLKQERKAYVVADSAEPKSIAEIKQHGVKIIPTSKGSDSINFGISILQEKKILITKRSSNLIEEFQKYTWAKDKKGDTMNKPVDIYNHGIDAVRYFSMQFLTQKKNSIKVRA